MPNDFGIMDQGVVIFSHVFPYNQALAGLISIFLFLLIVSDLFKYWKYRTREETLELASLGVTASFAYFLTGDLLLAALIFLFVSMVLGTISVRKSEIWFKMTLVFTITYGYVLGGYILGNFIFQDDRIFGITWVSSFWVLLVLSFIVFGKKYLLVSRFMSPNYVYLFLYILVYLLILQIGLPWKWTYVALLLGNAFIYCLSGWLLTVLFGVKPLEDPRMREIVSDISKKLDITVKKVGIVKAPILNAFAYGPFFDQRIAFIAEDLAAYDEDEIKGVTAHELAHLKRKHTLQLLLLSAVELFIKWLVGAPASYIDYAVKKDVTWNFLDFYIFNLAIFVILLIYVRVLEAEADEITQKLGLGKELADALYHLESFYQGIAGSMGLSVHLLTGKKRPHYQVVIDAGDAARHIVNHAANASRMALVTNLIMSHPPSAFRIIGVLHPEKFSKYKLALLPLLLLLPKIRKKYHRQLAEHWKELDELLTKKYLKMGHSLQEYVDLTLSLHQARPFIGQEVYAVPSPMTGLPVVNGVVKKVKIGSTLMNAVVLVLEDKNDPTLFHEVSYFTHSIIVIHRDGYYYLKNGQLALLKDVSRDREKNRLHFEYKLSSHGKRGIADASVQSSMTFTKERKLNYLGFSLEQLLKANPDSPVSVVFRHGNEKFLAEISGFELQPCFKDCRIQLQVRNSLAVENEILPTGVGERNAVETSKLNFFKSLKRTSQGKIELKGREIIITRGVLSIDASSLINLFEFLKEREIPLYLFLVNDPDNYIICLIESCTKNSLTIKVGSEELTYSMKEIDGVLIEWPGLWQLQLRKELGFLGKLSRKLANRGLTPSFLM